MCHNYHVSNDVYNRPDSVSAFDANATNEQIVEEAHLSPTGQHEYATDKVLRVSGKVPTTFMQSLISSLHSMGCSVTIIDDKDECGSRETVRLS